MARPLYEEPFVLATAGTLAVHLIIAVAGDAIVVTHPYIPEKDPPHVELVDVQVPEPPPPPPPLPAAKEPEPAPVAPKVVHTKAISQPPPVASETPPPKTDTPPPPMQPGGGPVVAMDSLGPDATGHVAVAVGKMPQGHLGRGGSGAGTGAGSGSGAGDAPARDAVSVATIKTRALPKGDYGYIDASHDYPPEAKQLGIEGPVRVRLVVDDRGQVTRATLLPPGLGHGLDELALRKAKDIQFEPARDTEDHPVTSVVVWTFNMTLPK